MNTERNAEPIYHEIASLFRSRTGILAVPSRGLEASAGIRRAMAKLGIDNPAVFHDRLIADRHAFDTLAIELTIGETYFFREPAHFEAIRREFIADFCGSRPASARLRVWSAGCASGEEAYSLAILCEQTGLAERAEILATDISRASLDKARRGSYAEWSLRSSPEAFIATYFRRSGKVFHVADRFKGRVAFEYLNLATDNYPSAANGTAGTDLILCRNVLIYLDNSTIRRVAERMLECLAPGGWLITGPSDPPLWDLAPFETIATPAGIIYKRRADSRDHSEKTRTSNNDLIPDPKGMARVSADASVGSAHPMRKASGRTPATPDPVSEAAVALERGDNEHVVELTSGLKASSQACLLHARALANLGDVVAANDAAAAAARRHPLTPEIHYLHAVLLLGMQRYDEAAAAVRRVIYLDRSSVMAYTMLGTILQHCTNIDGARRAFRNAHVLCLAQPGEATVPLSDGALARDLAAAIEAKLKRWDN